MQLSWPPAICSTFGYPSAAVFRTACVSRCGRAAGIGYQLGCHPGETGILSAAGRHWASVVPDIRYLEGSYDRHLLKELLTHEDITFSYGGR